MAVTAVTEHPFDDLESSAGGEDSQYLLQSGLAIRPMMERSDVDDDRERVVREGDFLGRPDFDVGGRDAFGGPGDHRRARVDPRDFGSHVGGVLECRSRATSHVE